MVCFGSACCSVLPGSIDCEPQHAKSSPLCLFPSNCFVFINFVCSSRWLAFATTATSIFVIGVFLCARSADVLDRWLGPDLPGGARRQAVTVARCGALRTSAH